MDCTFVCKFTYDNGEYQEKNIELDVNELIAYIGSELLKPKSLEDICTFLYKLAKMTVQQSEETIWGSRTKNDEATFSYDVRILDWLLCSDLIEIEYEAKVLVKLTTDGKAAYKELLRKEFNLN